MPTTFSEFIARLIEYSENKKLILSKQTAIFALYNTGASVEYTVETIEYLYCQ